MSLFPKEHKPRGPAKQQTLRIRSSDLEMLRYREAAKVHDVPVATWARIILRENAVRILSAGGKNISV